MRTLTLRKGRQTTLHEFFDIGISYQESYDSGTSRGQNNLHKIRELGMPGCKPYPNNKVRRY